MLETIGIIQNGRKLEIIIHTYIEINSAVDDVT